MSYPAILERFYASIRDENPAIAEPDIKSGGHMDVYVNGYRMRLTQAIRTDYPALLSLLSDKKFNSLALAYIEVYPPECFNLDSYPHGFADFISNQFNNPFACEVALLESAIAKVFMGKESKPLDSSIMAQSTPGAFARMQLKPRKASCLMEFTYPVNDWLNRWKAEESPSPPSPQAEYVYIYRHMNNVQRYALSEPAYLLLKQLFSNQSVEEAVANIVTTEKHHAPEILKNTQKWFAEWLIKGVFRIDS